MFWQAKTYCQTQQQEALSPQHLDVLGTQIARIEEYGIGSNPESFACYGYEKYFTDSKRGVVIQLKGMVTAMSNYQ